MGTTSEELKKFYKKLGGKDPKVAGFSAPGEILNAINEIPLPTEYELPTVTTEDAGDVLVVNEEGKWDKGEAGGGLPEVTTDDNGDILQVIEGAWAKAVMSNNVEVFYVNDSSNRLTLENEKKLVDIANAYNDGKLVLLETTTSSCVYVVHECRQFNNSVTITAVGFYITSGTRDIYIKVFSDYMAYQNDNYITNKIAANLNGQILPSVSSSDAGKTVIVNPNGYWTKSDPPAPTHAYSTTEQVVGTWIDGKPVYEKTIDCGAISANTWNQTATGVDDIDNVISIGGFIKSDTAVIPFTTNTTSSDVTILYVRNQNKFQYWAIGSNITGVIIFRYTKTTD